jgi:type IV secretion system protein VirB3
MESSLTEREKLRVKIFKGATRPAMMGGVPFIPFFVNAFAHVLFIVWALVFGWAYIALLLAFTGFMFYLLMRVSSMKDDQRLLQWVLRLKLRLRQANRRYWGVNAYAPLAYKRATNAKR